MNKNYYKKYFLGIDPGITGAFALIDTDGEYIVHDFDGEQLLAELLLPIQFAVIEQVHAMPGQGVVSMFNFGKNYGWYQGLLTALRIPYALVTPATWKKGVVFPTDGATPKERSLTVARRMFPKANLKAKSHHNRADALLLARYCYVHHGGLNIKVLPA